MTATEIVDAIKNLGVPVALLVWIFWRGEYYLRRAVNKLDKFNDELDSINLSLRDIHSELKK